MAYTVPTFGVPTQPKKQQPLFTGQTPPIAPTNNTSVLNGVGDFINSPAGAGIIEGVGGFIDAREQAAQEKARLAQQQAALTQQGGQSQAALLQRQLESEQQNQLQRSQGILSASPLGANNSFAAKQAMMAAILPQLRNANFTPGDPAVAAAMPNISGGLRLPEGGFGPEALAAFSPKATARAIASRENDLSRLDPGRAGNPGTLDTLGLGNANPELGNEMQSFQAQQLEQQNQAQAANREAIMRALDNDPTGAKQANGGKPPQGYEYDKKTGELKKKGGGFVGGLLKVAKIAAPIALAATGVGIPAAIGVSAALNAVDAKRKGATLAQSLGAGAVGGAMGAIPGAGGLGGVAGAGLKAGLKQAILPTATSLLTKGR